MEKGILIINLLHNPTKRHGNGENNTYCSGFKNRTKNLTKINSRLLMKTFCNKANFVSLNWTIGMTLDSKNPFTANNIASNLRKNKSPCLIFKQSIEFQIHSFTPLGIFNSETIASGFRGANTIKKKSMRDWIMDSTISECFWFDDVVLGLNGHGVSWLSKCVWMWGGKKFVSVKKKGE